MISLLEILESTIAPIITGNSYIPQRSQIRMKKLSSSVLILLATLGFIVPLMLSCGNHDKHRNAYLHLSENSPNIGYNWKLKHGPQRRIISDIWLNQNGAIGWAVGDSGRILKLSNGKWGDWNNGQRVTSSLLTQVCFSSDGNEGWATGENGLMLHYTTGKWKVWESEEQLFEGTIQSMSLDSRGANGWAISGGSKNFLRYSAGTWEEVSQQAPLHPGFVAGLCLNEQGTEGWAFRGNSILKLTSGEWKTYFKIAQPANVELGTTYVAGFWLNELGTEGWLSLSDGTFLHLASGKLEKWNVKVATSFFLFGLSNIRMLKDGTDGWAIGSNGNLFHYSSGSWQIYKTNDDFFPGFRDLWMNDNGNEGWAITSWGMIYHYANGKWTTEKTEDQITSNGLKGLWFMPNGKEGWAVGENGTILHYASQSWKELEISEESTSSTLNAVCLTEGGKEGFAFGSDGLALRYSSGKWTKLNQEEHFGKQTINDIKLSADGSNGWAVGDSGIILHFDTDQWRNWNRTQMLEEGDLNDLWVNSRGTEGWAVGFGKILHLSNNEWDEPKVNQGIQFANLTAIAMNSNQTEGWATSGHNSCYHFSDGNWMMENNCYSGKSIQLNKEAEEGWGVGENGIISRYRMGKWEEWSPPYLTSRFTINDLWINPNGTTGWAIGEHGTILFLDTFQIQRVLKIESLETNELEALSGDYVARLGFTPKIDPIIELIDVSTGKDILNEKLFSISTDTADRQLITVHFSPEAEEFADRNRGKQCKFRFSAQYGSSEAESARITYVAELKIGGSSTNIWSFLGWGTIGYFILNIISIPLAIISPWIRRLLFSNYGYTLLVGKPLFSAGLIHWSMWYRIALFRHYRKALIEVTSKSHWGKRIYIPPMINGHYSENQWQLVLEKVLESSGNELFVVHGRSGLGKTALLEKWCQQSLELGQTPILIRLSSENAAIEEATALTEQHGEIPVDRDRMFDLLKKGGFLVLLDGLNEDSNPKQTREFVRQIVRNNKVVITSQLDPLWNDIVATRFIKLEPFGLEQLTILMGEEWAEKVLNTPSLKEWADLPHTAHLIANYVSLHNCLPPRFLDIYRMLRGGLNEELQTLNLELKAWEMFQINANLFVPDQMVPESLCDLAVVSGVFTRKKNEFMFRHERILRFFVASYLSRQEYHPMQYWSEMVKGGYGKTYWSDVVEFWGEIHLESISSSDDEENYKRFILDIAQFDISIYRERLKPSLTKLKEEGAFKFGEDFWFRLS